LFRRLSDRVNALTGLHRYSVTRSQRSVANRGHSHSRKRGARSAMSESCAVPRAVPGEEGAQGRRGDARPFGWEPDGATAGAGAGVDVSPTLRLGACA
jgi:hypothetical protein